MGKVVKSQRRKKARQVIDKSDENGIALRALKLALLDEINELRRAASLDAVTRRQFEDKIIDKINTGSADRN